MREQQGINNTHLKSRNRGLVLQWIASEDNPSRVEIARHIGLTKMTVTNIVSDWIQAGYVEEKEAAVNATVGRNPIILDIADNAPLAMGLYLSRTAATILLADLKLRVHYRDRLLLESENAETITGQAGTARTESHGLAGGCPPPDSHSGDWRVRHRAAGYVNRTVAFAYRFF